MKIAAILHESELIVEGLGSLKHLPPAWIKDLTTAQSGENSNVEKFNVKVASESGIKNALDAAFNKATESGYSGAYISINDEPWAMIQNVNSYGARPEFSFKFSDGAVAKVNDTHQRNWTGKYSGTGANRKYIPAEYYTTERQNLNKTELTDKMIAALYQFAKTFTNADGSLIFGNENGGIELKSFLKANKVDVYSVSVDMKRLSIKRSRIAASSVPANPMADIDAALIAKSAKNVDSIVDVSMNELKTILVQYAHNASAGNINRRSTSVTTQQVEAAIQKFMKEVDSTASTSNLDVSKMNNKIQTAYSWQPNAGKSVLDYRGKDLYAAIKGKS